MDYFSIDRSYGKASFMKLGHPTKHRGAWIRMDSGADVAWAGMQYLCAI